MENLRKRVGDLQLDKNFKRKIHEEVERDDEDEPLLKNVLEQTTDKDFIIDCLCWHNEYRARHNVPAMTIAMKLCVSAQEWANHLASRNELYYCPSNFNFGQNIFCCVETCLMLSISGQEVATYWYSSMKRYDFFKRPSLLHTSINSGHFSQIVWKDTKYIGVGKSVSKTGKIFVVGESTAVASHSESNFV
jgi:Cysteine-rich secretory protein family